MPRGRIGRGGGGTAIGVDTMPRPLGGYKLYRSAETLRLDPESGRRDPLNPDLSHIVPSLISEDDLKACVGRLNEVVLDFDVRTVRRVYHTGVAIGLVIATLLLISGPISIFISMATYDPEASTNSGRGPRTNFGSMATFPVGMILMFVVIVPPALCLKSRLDAETARVQQACYLENDRSECSNIMWSARKDQTVILAPKNPTPQMINAQYHNLVSGVAPIDAQMRAMAAAGPCVAAPPTAAARVGAPVVTVVPGQPVAAEAPPVGIVVEPNKGDPGGSSTADTSGEPLAERLIRLKELLDAGALTQDEYSAKRDELLEHV